MTKVAKNINGVPVVVSGGGSGVETVTGTLVDNTDPLNPVINTEINDASLTASTTTLSAQKITSKGYTNYFVDGVITTANQLTTVQTIQGVTKNYALFLGEIDGINNPTLYGLYFWDGSAWVAQTYPTVPYLTINDFLFRRIFTTAFGDNVGKCYIFNEQLADYSWSEIGSDGVTNLGYTASPTNGIVTSDTGTDATIPLADATNAGLLKPADFTKLSTLASDLSAKAPLASPTFTGTVTTPAIIVSLETASRVAIIDASKNVKSADTATYPDLVELSRIKGVTSAIQTQLDSKQATLSIASDAEMQTGTDNVKYTTALRITTWWTWIKTQAQTIAGLWTFSAGITLSGGRLLFTNTSTASGDGWYRQASNVLRAAINGTDRLEINNTGVKTKGTHTFESTMYTNLAPTSTKIGTIQTTGELTADYTPTTLFQGIQRNLTTLVSSTTETPIFNPEIGATLIPSIQMFLGSQWLYTVPFKLSTTGTVRFLVRFGEAATALTSRTIIADTGTFSPAVTAQGGVLKVMFSVGNVGASGTANVVCNIECQINGKNSVITVPLRTSSGVSTLVDNLLEITCLFGTNSASDRIDVEMGNSFKLS